MTTAYTSLLGLALPVQGELQGTWGDTVNNSITSLLDTAVAGTTTLSTDADVTLTATTGSSNQARQAILLCSGARTAVRTITAPAQSKAYIIINATTGGYGVKIVGAGPTTGITVAAGHKALVAWNGSDFVFVSGGLVDLTADVTGVLPVANGGTGSSSTTFVNLTTNVTGTLPVANGGTGVTTSTGTGSVVRSNSPTLVTPALGTPSSGTVTNLTGTASININGTVGATTPNTGAFTTLSSSSTTDFVGPVGIGASPSGTYKLEVSTDASIYGVRVGRGAANKSTNTVVGASAMVSNSGGDHNTAVGNGALNANVSGDDVTAIGYYAAATPLLTGGSVSVGSEAARVPSSTSANIIGVTAVGYQALKFPAATNADLTYNTAVGYQALTGTSATSASNQGNTAVGSNAASFEGITSGSFSYNVAVGLNALYCPTATTSTNEYNTGVGYNALSQLDGGNYNVGVGYAAGSDITSGSKNSILGSFTGLGTIDIRTASNYVVLSDGDGNVRFYTDNNGYAYVPSKLTVGAAMVSKSVAIAASNIDLATANYFTKTISGTTTFTLSNVAASGSVSNFILQLTNGGSASLTWWAGIKWANGTPPTLTTAGTDLLSFYTLDGGSSWYGVVLGQAMA